VTARGRPPPPVRLDGNPPDVTVRVAAEPTGARKRLCPPPPARSQIWYLSQVTDLYGGGLVAAFWGTRGLRATQRVVVWSIWLL